LTDTTSISSLIKKIKPDEIYNLAAQSHVAISFEVPEYTSNADALGALRILEAIKFHKLEKKNKILSSRNI
jgi:GDPmannose 4,6-dehydratase